MPLQRDPQRGEEVGGILVRAFTTPGQSIFRRTEMPEDNRSRVGPGERGAKALPPSSPDSRRKYFPPVDGRLLVNWVNQSSGGNLAAGSKVDPNHVGRNDLKAANEG